MPLILYHNAWGGSRNACQIKDNSNNKQSKDAHSQVKHAHIKKLQCTFWSCCKVLTLRYMSAGVCQTGADIPCIHVASASSKPNERHGGGWRTCCVVQGGSNGPQTSAASGQNPRRHAALLTLSQEVLVCLQHCCLRHLHCYDKALHPYLDDASPSVQQQHLMQ